MRKRLASIALTTIFAAAVLAGPASAAVVKLTPNSTTSTVVQPQPKGHGGGHMHW
ncbi:MAG: hypothetical protein ABSC51_05125 [Gaiellaceae bacterium]|jgi:hypothetical protein